MKSETKTDEDFDKKSPTNFNYYYKKHQQFIEKETEKNPYLSNSEYDFKLTSSQISDDLIKFSKNKENNHSKDFEVRRLRCKERYKFREKIVDDTHYSQNKTKLTPSREKNKNRNQYCEISNCQQTNLNFNHITKSEVIFNEDVYLNEQFKINEARKRREELKMRLRLQKTYLSCSNTDMEERPDTEVTCVQGESDVLICNQDLRQKPVNHYKNWVSLNHDLNSSHRDTKKIVIGKFSGKKKPTISVDIFANTTPETKIWGFIQKTNNFCRNELEKSVFKDSWDDPEGYYNFAVGEIIDERYEVFAAYGRGVFSTVLRAVNLNKPESVVTRDEVAIKVIRSNDAMTRASQMERMILCKLALTDPEIKRHIINLIEHFEYRSHVCLVFEPMDMNLRMCIKKFGRDIGLSINAVRAYTIQMLVGLKHLKNNGILHADIKPDNLLVDESKTDVRICDFGSAMLADDIEITPYLVSRFYRPPEVILGLPYGSPMDIWSIGCVIYELFTGKILFSGRTNNDMIKQIMNLKGSLPKKMLRKGAFTERHFDLSDPGTPFLQLEENIITKCSKIRKISGISTKNSFLRLLTCSDRDRAKVFQLADLLERMMMLDPDKRLTTGQALKHPFCVYDH
jgi:serine/threonine-protein kinase PRP4